LPTSGGGGWTGRLTRSLQGTGFHRELSYELELRPCGGGSSIAGAWQRIATVLRLPRQLGSCAAAGAADTCHIALVQPLPAAVYADVDQLRNLVASWQGSLAAMSFQLFGVADAERTEVECTSTALLLRWTAAAAQGQAGVQRAGDAVGGRAGPAPALPPQRHRRSTITQRAIPLHARYPEPVAWSGAGRNLPRWLAGWQSPEVTTVLPWPQVRVRCGRDSSAVAGWQQVWLAHDPGDAVRMAWGTPAGNLHDAAVVNSVTALAYLVGASLVLRAILRSMYAKP
jgi:PIG-X / PBN1